MYIADKNKKRGVIHFYQVFDSCMESHDLKKVHTLFLNTPFIRMRRKHLIQKQWQLFAQSVLAQDGKKYLLISDFGAADVFKCKKIHVDKRMV